MTKNDKKIRNKLKLTKKFYVSSIKNSQMKAKVKKQKKEIPVHDILRVMAYPQPIASKILNVSISTLKRRYYELNFGRWPINSATFDDEQRLEMKTFSNKSLKDNKISSIINLHEQHENCIDDITAKILNCVFKSTAKQ